MGYYMDTLPQSCDLGNLEFTLLPGHRRNTNHALAPLTGKGGDLKQDQTAITSIPTVSAGNNSTLKTLVAAGDNPNIEQVERRFQFLDPDELMSLPPRRWLVHPLLGVGEIGMIYGESGIGKSFLVIDLLISCAAGQKFAGYFDVDEAVRVAYCAGEGTGGLAERFKAAIGGSGLDRALLKTNLTVCLDVPNLFEAGVGLHQFIADYKASGREGLDLLVIDTLHSATAGANENSAQDVGKIEASIKYLRKTLGCAVLLVHHANRAGTGERGSSALRGSMDVMIEVSKMSEAIVLRCSKLKDGRPFQPVAFSLVEKEGSAYVVWQGAAPTTTACDGDRTAQTEVLAFFRSNPGQRFKASTVGDRTDRSRDAARQICDKLHKRGQVQRETDHVDRKTQWYWYAEAASASRCE